MARPDPVLLDLARGRPLREPVDPAAFLASAIEHRMTGLVWGHVTSGALTLDPATRAELMHGHLLMRSQVRHIWDALSEVATRMAPLGIQLATFKGPTAAARWYDAEGERPFGDLDLLVGPADHWRAAEIAAAIEPDHALAPVLQQLADAEVLPSVDLVLNGVNVDLHFDLLKFEVPGRHLDLFWARTLPYQLNDGNTVRVLDPEASLVHFLIHVNRDRFRHLLGHIDVARVVQRENLDWDIVLELMRSEGLEVPLLLTLEAIAEVMELQLPPLPMPRGWRAVAWRRLWSPEVRLRGDEGSFRYRNRHRALPFLARGRARDGLRHWVRYAVPPRSMMDVHFPETSGPYWWRNVTGRLHHVAERRRASRPQPVAASPDPSRGTGPTPPRE
jgi:hypothetical protein